MKTAIYLRKSRTDEEIERQYGEGETLAKHRNTLLKFAKENNIAIIKIYEEIVSGESLIHRPEMLDLLKNIESKTFDAVLCMDIDRLGRGNMQEQGLILDTFKKSGAKIITLRKTYDLNNDFDEEYSEFEAFMSRKELKLINRRLQRGRIRSVEEGNYIGTLAPYGYIKSNNSLVPDPEQTEIVKLIFDYYANQNLGASLIADKLNSMGIRTYTGIKWSNSLVLNILKNEVYVGNICWKKKENLKSIIPGKKREVKLRPKEQVINVPGKHEPIISIELFNKAAEVLKSRYHVPYQASNFVRNPLAGLIVCKVCGSKMHYRPYGDQDAHITCDGKCGNKSSKFFYVEIKLLICLENWINYEIESKKDNSSIVSNVERYKKSIVTLNREIEDLNKQKFKIYDLLEQGIYNIDTFLERSKSITERIDEANINLENLKKLIDQESKITDTASLINNVRKIIDVYKNTSEAKEKNLLLKSILIKAEYYKTKQQKNDDFTLVIFPRLPI